MTALEEAVLQLTQQMQRADARMTEIMQQMLSQQQRADAQMALLMQLVARLAYGGSGWTPGPDEQTPHPHVDKQAPLLVRTPRPRRRTASAQPE